MKKIYVYLCFIFCFSVQAFPQQQYGNLRGIVIDSDGQPLPGVSVKLESQKYALRSMVTTTGGIFRFINISPSTYTLRCELVGFKTYVQENLQLRVGVNFDLEIVLEQTTLQEEVTITAESPIVDTKKVGITTNVTLTQLQEVPSARDPWVILQQTPGVFVWTENVGGSHSGQQSVFFSKGVTGGAHMYNIDGVAITDMAAVPNDMWESGTSGRYYDFDSFEEIQIVTGGAGAAIQSSGVSINFITRRGGNKYEFLGRIFYTGDDLQGDNRTQELIDLEYEGNRIDQITDYGLQMGGPIKRDKLWFWLGYGVQDIRRLTIDGFPQAQKLESVNAKLNFQISRKNRAELAFLYTDKTYLGRNANPSRTSEATLDQTSSGHPFVKFEDEHTFSDNFLLSLKLAGSINGEFEMNPKGGLDVQGSYDMATGIFSNTTYQWLADRPTYSARVDGNLYRENLLGGNHEITFGVEYRLDPSISKTKWPQDAFGLYWKGNPVYAQVFRPEDIRFQGDRYSLHFNDSYSKGRFTLNLGFRFDREKSVVNASSVPASTVAPEIMPALTFPAFDPDVSLNTFSPRLGVTYALTSDLKTILRMNLARYGIQNGSSISNLVNPAAQGWAQYRWNDKNGDFWVTTDELVGYPTAGILRYGGFDPKNPTRLDDPDAISPDLKSIITDELLIGAEREIFTDFSLSTTFILRRTHQLRRKLYFDAETGFKESQENWLGPIQNTLTFEGVTYNYEYWTLDRYRPAGKILETAPDQHVNYAGIEINAVKRLSHKWMMNASFTYQSNNWIFGNNGYLDPTNLDKWDRAPRNSDPRWMAKISFLVQLPWGFNFSGFANAREGVVFKKLLNAPTPERGAVGIGSQTEIYVEEYGKSRLPDFYNMDFSLLKEFLLGKYGKLSLQVDAFNIFNFNHSLVKYQTANTTRYDEIQMILNPRVIRFGIRYRF